jgi:hypothetical protein
MKLRNLVLSLTIATLAQHARADVYEASFDGGWFDPAQGGRGIQVDYIPLPNGAGQYFIAMFTYDQAGAAQWIIIQADGVEGQRVFKNADVRALRGGNFGNPFVTPSPQFGTVIGKAELDLVNCNEIKLSYAPAAGSVPALPATSWTYRRLGNSAAGADFCPFKTNFTACPTGTVAVAGQDRVCEIPGGTTLTGNIRLNNSASYVIGGRVEVGAPMAADGTPSTQTGTLTVEPGTVIRGKTPTSWLVVNPGSKIFAEGTPTAPIVFTGATEVAAAATQGSWGGLIIAGRAPINRNCTGTGITCAFEADSRVIWGGNVANDNSGVLKYVQIRSAGGIVTPPDKDLNALTLGGVGRGTTIEFVQAHDGTDDGFEMFGGNVNLRYIVATGNNDDSLDTDFGYVGNIQYAYVKMDEGSVADSNGIESDNGGASGFLETNPRTRPVLSNATFDGGNRAFDAIKVRRASGFALSNVVAYNFLGSCININDAATYTAAAPTVATGLTGTFTMTNSLLGCTKNFDDVAADPWLVSAWYNGQTGNAVGDVAAALPDGRMPGAASILRSGAGSIGDDSFFQTTSTRGAFADGDWTDGWTTAIR